MARTGYKIIDRGGIGDSIQFSSVPENYFKCTGQYLIDTEKNWIFDDNPFIKRDIEPATIFEPWHENEFIYQQGCFTSNAERNLKSIHPKLKVYLNRPRLYRHEDYPYKDRQMILIHAYGTSHGPMPRYIIKYVLEKYKGCEIYQIGRPDEPDIGVPRLKTNTVWDLVNFIAKAKMLIGVDSGPAWIAACYPDVIVKKVRLIPEANLFEKWIPMEARNPSSHWDDHFFQTYNITADDIGPFQSYLKI